MEKKAEWIWHLESECAKGAEKASCRETVVQKGVFGESVSSLLPLRFSGVLRANLKRAEKKRTLQKHPLEDRFSVPPLLWRRRAPIEVPEMKAEVVVVATFRFPSLRYFSSLTDRGHLREGRERVSEEGGKIFQGQKKHINIFNLSLLPLPKTHTSGPQQKRLCASFLGKDATRDPHKP